MNDSGNKGCTQSRISSVLKGEKKHFQNRKEKSTGILVGIILVFVLCHIFRLCIQVYEIVSPTHGLHTHFYKCEELKRLHVPAVVLVAGKDHHTLSDISAAALDNRTRQRPKNKTLRSTLSTLSTLLLLCLQRIE